MHLHKNIKKQLIKMSPCIFQVGNKARCRWEQDFSKGTFLYLLSAKLMRTLASGVHSVVDATNKLTWITEVLWRKRDNTATLWEREHPNPYLDRLLLLSNSIHQRRFSFIMLRFALGDYFLQRTKERMLVITSYRLTRKKCCKCKGTIRVIGLVTFCPWEN